ncbi:hypothetical protein T01_3435 [Trichinella spiralis]|uniref:Uncharacterized protein n=1 Tax=Trichinella spiralis TaxID=6334 RepID=A0A0V1BCZ1_TRISP|nr:hypothetical protein T01_3435 [Trichinella spiralis]
MYLQIQIHEGNRDACRFLWRDEGQGVRKYQLTRVCFRLTCSPLPSHEHHESARTTTPDLSTVSGSGSAAQHVHG